MACISLTNWVSAGSAAVQAVGAVVAIVFTVLLARQSAEREKAVVIAAIDRERAAAAAADAKEAERRDRRARADARALLLGLGPARQAMEDGYADLQLAHGRAQIASRPETLPEQDPMMSEVSWPFHARPDDVRLIDVMLARSEDEAIAEILNRLRARLIASPRKAGPLHALFLPAQNHHQAFEEAMGDLEAISAGKSIGATCAVLDGVHATATT